MLCILLIGQFEPATHQGSEEVVGHVPGPERWQGGSVLASNLVTSAARNPPAECLLVVELLHQAFLGQVVHAMVDLLGLAKRHIPVSEQTPVTLAVYKATL